MPKPENTIDVSIPESMDIGIKADDELAVGIGGIEVPSSPHATKLKAPKVRAELKISGVKIFEFMIIPFLCNLLMKINKIWKKSTTNLKKSV